MNTLTVRQKEIVDESIKLIAERGIQELTIKNISGRIGVSEPAIYRHFNSKIDILFAILDYFEHEARKLVSSIDENDSALGKIKTIFISRCRVFADNPHLAVVIFSEDSFRSDSQLSGKVFSIMKYHAKVFSALVMEGQANNLIRSDIGADQLCLVVMGVLRLMVTRWRYSEFSFDLAKEADKNWEVIEKLIKKQ